MLADMVDSNAVSYDIGGDGIDRSSNYHRKVPEALPLDGGGFGWG